MIAIGHPRTVRARDIDDDLPKIRRFSLTVGGALLLYAVAGVQVKSSIEVAVLGLRFDIARPDTLSVALAVVALWSMARYYHYAMILTISPMRARRALRRGELPSGDERDLPDQAVKNGAAEAIARYFPPVRRGQHVAYDLTKDSSGAPRIVLKRRPFLVSAAALWQSIDYAAPIWLTSLAVLFWLGCRSWGRCF
jgi:hypothetical protein